MRTPDQEALHRTALGGDPWQLALLGTVQAPESNHAALDPSSDILMYAADFANHRQTASMSALLLCLLMSACGGGGGGDVDAPRTGSDTVRISQNQSLAVAPPDPVPGGAGADAREQAAPDDGVPSGSGPESIEAMLSAFAWPAAYLGDETAVPGVQIASARGGETVGIAALVGPADPARATRGPGAAEGTATMLTAQSYAGSGAGAGQSPVAPKTESTADLLAEPARGIVAPDRLASEDWAGLTMQVRQSPAIANWIAGQRRLVDAWAARKLERADLVGGWIHDYVDPRTGVPLVWKEDTPEPASGGPGEDRLKEAWATYVRYRNISYTLTAARIFRATGERAYADWAMRQLDFYADNYERWPLRTVDGRARMFREGLAEAVRVFTLLEAQRLLAGEASPERQQRWAAHLFRPIAENLKAMTYPMTNVGLWHQAAIAAIGMRLRDEDLVQYALNNPQGIRAILAYGVTSDFLWIEGTFAYNAYVIECLAKLLTHASIEGYAPRFAPEWLVARRLLLSPIDYRFDDGSLPVAGDTTVKLQAIDPAVHQELYRLVPSYWGVERARSAISWEALIDPPIAFRGGAPTVPTAATRNFPEVRMAVLRSGLWQAYAHYGQAVGTHAEEEALTFELHHGKTPISTGSGTVDYSSPYHTRYFRRAAAHNVPLIDGVGQAKWEKGTIVDFSHPDSRLVVSQPDYNQAAAAEREYRVTPSGFFETTRITLKGVAPRPAQLGEAFHTDCAIEPGVGLSPGADLQLPSADPLTFWTVQSRYTASGSWSVHLKCGALTYRLGVTGSGAQRVFLGTAPTTPLPKRTNVVYYDTMSTDTTYKVDITALP